MTNRENIYAVCHQLPVELTIKLVWGCFSWALRLFCLRHLSCSHIFLEQYSEEEVWMNSCNVFFLLSMCSSGTPTTRLFSPCTSCFSYRVFHPPRHTHTTHGQFTNIHPLALRLKSPYGNTYVRRITTNNFNLKRLNFLLTWHLLNKV